CRRSGGSRRARRPWPRPRRRRSPPSPALRHRRRTRALKCRPPCRPSTAPRRPPPAVHLRQGYGGRASRARAAQPRSSVREWPPRRASSCPQHTSGLPTIAAKRRRWAWDLPRLSLAMKIWPGEAFPLGATYDGRGTNFSLFSEVATRVELCLFDAQGKETRVNLPEVTAL